MSASRRASRRLLIGDHAMRLHEDSGHRIWARPEAHRRLLVVAHEGTNAVILSHLLGITPVPWEWMRFSSAWAGISRLRSVDVASGAIWVLDAFNRIQHLDGLAKQGLG